MTTEKIAVSLPAALVKRAKRIVRAGGAPSMSAYVAAALEQKTTTDELTALLDEMLEETGGPLTPEERHTAKHKVQKARDSARRAT